MSAALDMAPTVELGIPAGARVVVAMSGGVDSSVAAALVAGAGCETIGVTLQLYDHGAAVSRPGACCAGQDIRDARRVADRLGIAHYVLDYEQRFRKAVIEDFAAAYAAGETPIPCVRCNERIKFQDLLETARGLGASALVTGHYVRRLAGPEGPELHRAADPSRDQSYFLFATTREQLDFLRFPLGGLPKAETRAIAGRLGLPVAAKPDSQDICFVPQGRYAAVVEKLRPGAAEPGDIVHVDGRVLGRHRGVIHYTVGQRRGLGLALDGAPLYVVRLDAALRRVVVGPQAALATPGIRLRTLNWMAPGAVPEGGARVQAKLRSASEPADATLHAAGDGGRIDFDVPQMAVAPGQAAVFYQGSRVLGGGWIMAAEDGASAA
jgi:tRNA-specific 2-thiouridylase